jgi:pimeloyl-ACP methyl ester carboxylesterase
MDTVDAGGHRIAYERKGEGPPLVLLHGYVGDRRVWRPQIDALSDEFTVVAWDAPGYGGSSDPPEVFPLSDFADCLAAFVDALDLGRPHVAGVSFGGGLALELYRRHPSLPRTLVLASAYAGWAGSLPAEVIEQRLQQALRLADQTPDDLVQELIPTMFTDSAPAELVEEFALSMREFHPVGLRANSRAFAEADLRDVLPHVAVPTLLLYGDMDVRAPFSAAAARQDPRLAARGDPRSGPRVQRRRPGALQRRAARLPSVGPGLTRNSWNSHLRPVIVVRDAPAGRRG